jgi:hypothetical protein
MKTRDEATEHEASLDRRATNILERSSVAQKIQTSHDSSKSGP